MRRGSAVEFQPVDDLVDHLALSAEGKSHQIEVGARDRPHGRAVGLVMRGLEHVLGIDGGRHAARQRPLAGPGEDAEYAARNRT